MSEKYTLKEVSELFGVNKSALRFWEKSGLIQSNRNKGNDYREYTKEDLLRISDILNYRFAHYSIKNLKIIDNLSVEENIVLLQEIQKEITEKKEELSRIENRIQHQLRKILLFKEMREQNFTQQSPDFDCIYHLHVRYKGNVMKYTNDHNLLAVALDASDTELKHFGLAGHAADGKSEGEILWKQQGGRHYFPFLMKVSGRMIDRGSIQSAIVAYAIEESKIRRIVARFIIRENENTYYQAWLETAEEI